MTFEDDQLLIKQRKSQDRRDFILRAIAAPQDAPRLAPALVALRIFLSNGSWHPWSSAVAVMLRTSDITVATADMQLRNAIEGGLVGRRGSYTSATPWAKEKARQKPKDTREVRFLDWPEA